MINFNNMELNSALEAFVDRLRAILGNKIEMICLFGSIMYDDLHPNYSDLDFQCLLSSELTRAEIDALFAYRTELKNSNNIYSQMLEGEFAPATLCGKDRKAEVAYWGTSRVKVFDSIQIRTFSLIGLIKNGIIIYGNDLRDKYKYPTKQEMLEDVYKLIETVRAHAVETNESIHSMDWFFLIAQSMYWLVKEEVISKSAAAEWVYENNSNEWTSYLPKALEIRRNPMLSKLEENRRWLIKLGPAIQNACDELELKYDIIIGK